MAVRIRLARTGRRKLPSYRVVVADSRAPRDGRFIAIAGNYDPKADPPAISIDEKIVLEWLGRGAEPTETVKSLLRRTGIWKKFMESKTSGAAA